MPQLQVVLQLNRDSYSAFATSVIAIPLSEREGAIITTLLFYLLDRNAWLPMSDSQWDSLEQEIQDVLEKLTP